MNRQGEDGNKKVDLLPVKLAWIAVNEYINIFFVYSDDVVRNFNLSGVHNWKMSFDSLPLEGLY